MSYDFMRSYNRADIALPSGIGVTISLVRVQDCLTAGGIPVGILKEMDAIAEATKAEENGNGKKKKEGPEPSPEVIDRGMWFRREIVRRSIRRVAPSVAELDGLDDDDDVPMWVVDKFEQPDFDLLANYALRNTPLPAGSPA